MSGTDDQRFMARAIQLANRGEYTTDPNPRVGCVLVRDGEIVGEGWHEKAGQPHAEVNALRQAGNQAYGATLYVSLEPCCHQGKTPPCTDAIIEASITRVVAAMEDPNPQVRGQGLKNLEVAGIETASGVLADEAEALNPGFVKRMRTGRPFVRCKLAMSLDGRTAMASGESRWITGPAARRDVHRLRARSSAIMTAIGTVLADDPSLTVRLDDIDEADRWQPLRVVLDRQLRMPENAKMLKRPGATFICTASNDVERRAKLEAAGAQVANVPPASQGVDLEAVLDLLANRQVNELLVECGPQLAGSLLEAGLLDELVIYMAPHLMGDAARGLFALPAIKSMKDRIALRIVDIRVVGDDWKIVAHVATSG